MPEVWTSVKRGAKRNHKFFLILFNDDDGQNHYRLNFEIMNHYSISLSELDNMAPYERDIYTSLIIADLKKKEDEQRKRQH